MNTEDTNQPRQAEPVNQQHAGVYRKFNVSRTDGRDQPGNDRHGAEYFVLDVTHDKFAKPALAAYAAACRNDYPALADDMVRRYGIAAQQQAEPVAWHTNDPCVSSEHIEAIAKACRIIPSHTTVEYVARIVGFGHVLLADKSVQEAFVRANSHLLRTDPTKPPAVAVPVAREFFAYDPECGFETFRTEAEAKKYAQDSIDSCREEASEGWPELVNNICWGVVLGATREVELPDEYNGCNGLAGYMTPVDYVLTDAAQPPAVATDAITDAMEANAWRAALRGLCTGRELMTPDECAEHVRHRIESAKSGTHRPDGYALVPIEPTPGMLDAADKALMTPLSGMERGRGPDRVYRAMLAAAQKGGA